MKKWRRRIRGAIGMGLTWGLAWLGAGLILLLMVGLDAADVPFPLLFGLLGSIAGATFSAILGIAEGRRRFDQMSLGRFAGWGAIGGVLLSAMFVAALALAGDATLDMLGLAPVFAVAGAGSAAGSLALARMSEERESLEQGPDAAASALNPGAERERTRGGT